MTSMTPGDGVAGIDYDPWRPAAWDAAEDAKDAAEFEASNARWAQGPDAVTAYLAEDTSGTGGVQPADEVAAEQSDWIVPDEATVYGGPELDVWGPDVPDADAADEAEL